MKITKQTLKQIIKEEYNRLLSEAEGEAAPQESNEPVMTYGEEKELKTYSRYGEGKPYMRRDIILKYPNGTGYKFYVSTLGQPEGRCSLYLAEVIRIGGEKIQVNDKVRDSIRYEEESVFSEIKNELIRRKAGPPKAPPAGSSWSSRAVYRDQMKDYYK